MNKILITFTFLIAQLMFAQSETKQDSLQFFHINSESDSVIAIGKNNSFVFYEKKDNSYKILPYCKLIWCAKVTEYEPKMISVQILESFLKPSEIEEVLAMFQNLSSK